MKWNQLLQFYELMLDAGTRTDDLFHVEFCDIKLKSNNETLMDVRISKMGRRNTIFIFEVVQRLRARYKSKNIEVKPSSSLWIDVGRQKRWSKQFFSCRFKEELTAVGLGLEFRMYC